MTAWRETYKGGSAKAERQEFLELARIMMAAQLKSKAAAASLVPVNRAFHAKTIAAFAGARLRFAEDLAEDLQVGFAQPGAEYPVAVRFSNAASTLKSDDEDDLRGLAIRVCVSETEHHDLLATNWPVPHANDAREFVLFAHAVAGGTLSRVWGIAKMFFVLGPRTMFRILGNVRKAVRPSESLAKETYWSRGAICWGEEAVRYHFKPSKGAAPVMGEFAGAGRLEAEFASRQAAGDISFDLMVQRFNSEAKTPIEAAAAEWKEADSPSIHVATLILPQRDLAAADAAAERRVIEDQGFNPWNTTADFRPLGNLNRARKEVYDASLFHRQRKRWRAGPVPVRNRIFGGLVRTTLRAVNRRVPWYRLPLLVSLLNLDALRHDLRVRNLNDTEPREAPPTARTLPLEARREERVYRTADGRSNDQSDPAMGAVGATFGRNMPVHQQSIDKPNAVTVARTLMDRHAFIPARTLNILAAAWIQFQVHDWVSHARWKLGKSDVRVPIPDAYPAWKNTPKGGEEREMRIAGNVPYEGDETGMLFANSSSHWWDGSEVYGNSLTHAQSLRTDEGTGAKLELDAEGYLPVGKSGFELTGFNESWWLGLSAMHTLFAREHNVVCDELRREHPDWSEEQIYQTARLIVSALIAKIHTVEWTPAILGTEALDVGMKTNWYGPPSGEWLTRLGIWLTDASALKGIPRTFPDHHAAPYSLTEEFATVYRMHPLIPDDYVFFDYATGSVNEKAPKTFTEIQGQGTDEVMRDLGLTNTLYSFGIAHPGAITLHNFPRTLQKFERDGELIDLSVVDIVRTRARGVPRYNGFRQYLRMAPIRRWEDMTPNPETNRLLKDVYGDVDEVDTVIGLLGEAPPAGFGFSDAAFRIFVLMASRRLQSDRFLNADFRPEIYSPLGMDWIDRNSFTTVLLRHCPELQPVLPAGATAFAPWRPIYGGA